MKFKTKGIRSDIRYSRKTNRIHLLLFDVCILVASSSVEWIRTIATLGVVHCFNL